MCKRANACSTAHGGARDRACSRATGCAATRASAHDRVCTTARVSAHDRVRSRGNEIVQSRNWKRVLDVLSLKSEIAKCRGSRQSKSRNKAHKSSAWKCASSIAA